MRAILLGRRIMPSDRGSTHWVAIADYIVGDQLADIPLGPKTKGLGEYPVATARETANEEANQTTNSASGTWISKSLQYSLYR